MVDRDPVDVLIDSWTDPRHPLSKHLDLAVADAMHRQRRGLPPQREGVPIPGCDCPGCTGIPADAPARAVPLTTRHRRAAYRREQLDVEGARKVPLLDVAERLGWDVGRYSRVLCPFHDDSSPSLHLNAKKQRAFCNVCSRSWDGIALYREVRGIDFPRAVKELTK